MKELIRGIVTFIASAIVFTPVILIGVLFNLVYPFYMAVKERSVVVFFKILWRLIDGTLSTLGNMLYEGFAVQWDMMGNVWGEWLEDSICHTEDSKFGEKNITISASIGHLEHENHFMYPRGHKLSKVLNFAFRERQHALGSWLKFLAYQEIKEKNLKGKR